MQCQQCDHAGKVFKGICKVINKEYEEAYRELNKKLEYLTYQCETRTQLKPIKLAPVTRYMCSNQHDWSV